MNQRISAGVRMYSVLVLCEAAEHVMSELGRKKASAAGNHKR